MRFTLLITILFSHLVSYAQGKVDCTFVDEAIHDTEFSKRFSVGKYQSSSIIIIDGNRYFDSCQFKPLNDKLITISRDQNYKIYEAPKAPENIIVLNSVDLIKRGYKLYFWRPKNNTMLVLEVTKCKNKLVTKVISSGSY